MRYIDNVQRHVMPNGFQIFTDHLPYARTTCAGLSTLSGDYHDPVDKKGLAHLSEHLMAHAKLGQSDQGFLQVNEQRSLLNFRLFTWYNTVTYNAEGHTSSVEEYLADMANGITHLDYSQRNFELEQSRIITEMKQIAGNVDKQKEILKGIALYGADATHARLNGGTVTGFRNISLADIVKYHQSTHVGANMALISSGAWTHDQMCEWAYEHLAHLDCGELTPLYDSPFTPHDIWTNNGNPASAEVAISFPAKIGGAEGRIALNLYAMTLSHSIKEVADDQGLYGIGLYGDYMGCDGARLVLTTNCAPHQISCVVEKVVHLLETSKEIFEKRFIETQKQFIQGNQLNYDANHITPSQRYDRISNALFFRRMAHDQDDYIAAIESQTPERILETIKDTLQQKPATFYYGAIRDDLPTGDMIQRRDFSGRSKKPIRRTQFDFTPFR
tara:strand:+ start:1033 stop:2364 length:1332 start_codon:yes stop_codon:yes gene_type:complete